MLDRAHAIKDKDEVSMGLFNYPVLMAADILSLQAELVLVGNDQKQHIEITRDISDKLQNIYGFSCILPKGVYNDNIIMGLDGRKMSKSYHNTIPLFVPSAELKELIYKIKTTSQSQDEPKDHENCQLFSLYKVFATDTEASIMAHHYTQGIGWQQVKETVFLLVDNFLAPCRARYQYLVENTDIIFQYLAEGKELAIKLSSDFLARLKQNLGLLT